MGIKTGVYKALYNTEATSWATRKFAIYIRTASAAHLEEFINTTGWHYYDPTTTDDAVITRPRGATVRHRYPGGPGIGVAAGSRKLVVGPSATRRVLPGRNIYLEKPKDGSAYDPAHSGVKMRTLTLTLEGSFPEFYLKCEANNRVPFILRTNLGRPIYVKHTGA